MLQGLLPRLGKAGALPGGGGKPGVALAAPAAMEYDAALACRMHIRNDPAALHIPHQGANRHPDDQVFPIFTPG